MTPVHLFVLFRSNVSLCYRLFCKNIFSFILVCVRVCVCACTRACVFVAGGGAGFGEFP